MVAKARRNCSISGVNFSAASSSRLTNCTGDKRPRRSFVTSGETDPRSSGVLLRHDLVQLFPQLSTVRVSHSWMGFVAYTFDTLAHLGSRDGIHYAMGYCGSGVSMAAYLGSRVGQKVLGLPEGRTALDDVTFQTRPLYTGRPWFLAASVAFYRWRDALGF